MYNMIKTARTEAQKNGYYRLMVGERTVAIFRKEYAEVGNRHYYYGVVTDSEIAYAVEDQMAWDDLQF